MKLTTYRRPAALLLLLLLLLSPTTARAATSPALGTAGTFAVLAGTTVTNTGPTTLIGDLGVSPGTAVTGFPPGLVTGMTHTGTDAVALQAQKDATAAYTTAAGQPCDVTLTGQDLGGKTLTPGVYCFASSAQLTGQLILDGQGNPSSPSSSVLTVAYWDRRRDGGLPLPVDRLLTPSCQLATVCRRDGVGPSRHALTVHFGLDGLLVVSSSSRSGAPSPRRALPVWC